MTTLVLTQDHELVLTAEPSRRACLTAGEALLLRSILEAQDLGEPAPIHALRLVIGRQMPGVQNTLPQVRDGLNRKAKALGVTHLVAMVSPTSLLVADDACRIVDYWDAPTA